MTTRREASNPADLGVGTLVELFLGAVERHGSAAALGWHADGRWETMDYDEVLHRVRRVAGALSDLGLERGDRAAILSKNCPEWAISDYGCLCAGVSGVPIYSTLTASQVAYTLEDSGARLVFVEDKEQLEKVLEVRGGLPELERVVVFRRPSGELPDGVSSWADFLERGAARVEGQSEDEFRDAAMAAEPEDTATILYTSGTTGEPKGVMLSHDNLRSNVKASERILPIDTNDTTLSFLPLSHVFQRMVDYLLFHLGCTIHYARSIDTVAEDLREVRPTIVVSVPRLYEKVYARVMGQSGVKGMLVRWARGVGARHADLLLGGRKPGTLLRMKYALARRLVFRKIREGVGGRLRYFVSGGAPLASEINTFFFSAGVMILEGYGLTETSPVTNVNSPADFPTNFRIGTVGKPVPGTEIRIADDGEILVRGPQVMKGYYHRPEATADVIDEDGWFHTGDIGEIDADGFLSITDRKKDIIVTAGGKNVAPQPIENRLKALELFDQPVLLGDRERFITLLLVPDFEAVEAWASNAGVDASDRRELLENPKLQKRMMDDLRRGVEDLAPPEQPKKIVLVDEPFTIEDGSLTPTQKVKRRVVQERYADLLETVYDEASREQDVFVTW